MAEIKQGGEQFASRWGLIATILGMAVGTGNIWRFPRELAACGGGAFAAGICAAILAFLSMLYFGAIGNLALLAVISAPMMFASVFALSYLKLKGLTDNGQYLAGQVLGLKHYMEDFSEFKDRGVTDMTLWGRYMVYATAFGISEKAMKQLLKDLLTAYKYGLKTLYYHNTRDGADDAQTDLQDDGCAGGACKI